MQHLDLRHVGRGDHKPLQPHAAAFHPNQALIAVAIGTYIIGNPLHPSVHCLLYSIHSETSYKFLDYMFRLFNLRVTQNLIL